MRWLCDARRGAARPGKGYEVNCCAVAMHRASQRH
nr:MAG TPA: hypothetical protein [Caudoviricetes sp.]